MVHYCRYATGHYVYSSDVSSPLIDTNNVCRFILGHTENCVPLLA
jgi:hypothetical protein